MTDLTALSVPGPTVTPITAPFWEAAAAGRLLVQHCESCGAHILYPRRLCPECWSDALDWIEASGKGNIRSWSRIHRPGHPGWAPVAPYVVGLVALAEGPCLLSYIHETGGAAAVGGPLRFAPTTIGGRVLPAFETVRTD